MVRLEAELAKSPSVARTFQFLYGAIGRARFPKGFALMTSFNSYMVRLEAAVTKL